MKPILAFDTSTAICAAALVSDGKILRHTQEDLKRGQAERLFPMIEELLKAQALDWSDLAGLAVGIGPGNFTGIRISVSGARGLALSLNIPLIGVSAFEVIANKYFRQAGAEQDVLISISGPQNSVYVQRYSKGAQTGKPYQLYLERPLENIDEPNLDAVIGDQANAVADLFGTTWIETEPSLNPAVDIALIAHAQMAKGATQFAPPAPLYIRAPDAAPARDKAPTILR